MKDALAFYFLFFFGLLLPYLSLKSVYGKKAERPPPPKPQLRVSAIFTLFLLGIMGIFTARERRIPLFPSWQPSLAELGITLGLLAFWLWARFALLPWLRKNAPSRDFRLLPDTWQDLPVWAIISLFAGFFEEIIYRGVFVQILVDCSVLLPVAVALSAAAFAFAHVRQGWRSVGFIFLFALLVQGLVYYAGNLYSAMILHALYDLIVGILTVREKTLHPATEAG